MADLFMALTSLAWGLAGLTVAIVPALGLVWARRILLDPWPRFWFGQTILLIGLLLMIGTTGLTVFGFGRCAARWPRSRPVCCSGLRRRGGNGCCDG